MKNIVILYAVAIAIACFSVNVQAQSIDLNCAAQGAYAAATHQCQSSGWRCYFAKARVGYFAYVACTNQTGTRETRFGRLRARRQVRVAARKTAF